MRDIKELKEIEISNQNVEILNDLIKKDWSIMLFFNTPDNSKIRILLKR